MSGQTILEERPHPGPQSLYLASPAFEVGYGGSLAAGKSWAITRGALRYMDNGNARAIIMRRTFPELRDLMDKAHQLMPLIGLTWYASEKRWVHSNGFRLEFGYCENWADVQQYVGQEYTYIGFDQLEQLPEERIWITLMSRLRTTDPTIPLMARATFNPGGPGHGWVKRRFILPCPPDGTPIYDEHGNTRAFFQATIFDNPTLLKNDPRYLQYLESLPETQKRQLLHGEWDAGEGIAFPGLTDRSHLVRAGTPVHGGQYFGAFDWGYGHKWAFGLFAVLPGGKVRVVDSVMGRRHTPDMIAERVAELLKMRGVTFGDLRWTVAGSDVKIRDEARGNYGPSVMEQFLAYGWPLMGADNSRVAGYQNLLMYLHQQRLEFEDTPGNRSGIGQLMELATDPDFPNDVLKVDVDVDTGEGGDDFYDMLRYGLMSRPIFRNLTATARVVAPDTGAAWQKKGDKDLWVPRTPATAMPGRRTRSVDVG